ncbi:MAG: hypothetical protein IIB80_08950 [Thaumarchaeota archaeon]|nr:hypothetical protein [Nitrososphaerota archaeon]
MGDKKKGSVSKQKLKAVLEHEHLWPRVRVYAVHEMKPMIEEIKKRHLNDVIRKSLVNYSIIRSVSAKKATRTRKRNASAKKASAKKGSKSKKKR